MKKEEIAALFQQGIDCSQVVAAAFADSLNISEEAAYQMSAAFGGGMGAGETCGAVVGAMIVLGMLYGHKAPGEFEKKEIMNEKRAEFLRLFSEQYPGYACRELLGYDIAKKEELEKILEEGLLFDFCPEVVHKTIDILEKVIS